MQPMSAKIPFRPELPHEEVMALPLFRYDGPIHLIATPDRLPEALSALQQERVLGFDTETRAAFRKGESYPPALLQLATARAVYLIQLHAFQSLGGLIDLLASATHLKVGVGLDFEVKKLRELYAFKPAGVVDLATL